MSEDQPIQVPQGAMEGLVTDADGKLQVSPVREPEFLREAEAINQAEQTAMPEVPEPAEPEGEVEDEIAGLLSILADHDDKLRQLDRDIAMVQQGMTLVLAKINEFIEAQQPKPQQGLMPQDFASRF